MLSRIADSMFWIARYMERAEEIARILDVNYHMFLDQSPQSYRLRWEPLVAIAGEQDRFTAAYAEANAQTVFEFLALRQDNPNSISTCLERARENARTIRERISREMWEDINGLYHQVRSFGTDEEVHRFCNIVKFGSHRFRGVTDATLTHDEAWQFLRTGWALERAEMTARIVDVQYHRLVDRPDMDTDDHHQWMAVLKSVGAFEAYCRLHRSRIEPQAVAELLILHPDHPRSIRFNMTELQAGLRAISGTGVGAYANEAERLTGKLLESLRYGRMSDVFHRGLHEYLTDLQKTCCEIGEQIGRAYFHYGVAG
jgi:uncharacterized alpha-E superfamily protein